jgi:hypothetical protein
MHGLDAVEALHFERLATPMDRLRPLWGRGRAQGREPSSEEIDPERTLIVRRRRSGFDAVAVLVSGGVTGMLFVFATVAALV